MGLQSRGSPHFRNFETSNLGVLKQSEIWVLALWPDIKNTIRGRWLLPPSPSRDESCEFMFAHGSYMHQKCSNYAFTNLLFGLYRSMWIIDLLVTHPSPHPRASTCPFTLKPLRANKLAPTPYPLIVFTWDSHLSLSRNLGMRQLKHKLAGYK
jgi:hypothetical protein